MTASGRCPVCGGELRSAVRRELVFRRCLSCATTLLDATDFDRLVPPDSPPGPVADRDYIEPQPQRDHGHASGRPRPPFAPSWGSAGAGMTEPDADGVRLMFGE